jgi:hypothetical protein
MAALTAYTTRRYRTAGASFHQNWRVANSDVIYIGSFCGIPGTSGLTSRRGYITTYRDAQTIQWAGVCIRSNYESAADRDLNQVTGATSNSPVPEAWTEAGQIILEQATVTGVSAQTAVGTDVWATSDNDLQNSAAPNGSPAVGSIVYWYSSTTCDVAVFGYLGSVIL